MIQDPVVQVGDRIEVLMPRADVRVMATVLRVEEEALLQPVRWFTAWTKDFGGMHIVLFTHASHYVVIDRAPSYGEAIHRVMTAKASAVGRDPEASS